ncbi:hypothetical protein UFOVP543_50 [uncultured Caudovirales phage]|uniref:Uncharacterized protein n=1 Tax=uncultured Caudovirales phage TaxID=2100421 RepID=A0A6J5MVH5_9CAUD|nr:hypothetical protein UFOVP543_50 [uncultured Caudovirales phage]CAB4163549.1 hypothetical protein UFOVP804_26 [uncultured Caudovirales phage]
MSKAKKKVKQGAATPTLKKLINMNTLKEPDFLYRACGHYLSCWPNNMSAKKVVERLSKGSNKGIDHWQPFEDYPPESVAELIEDMAHVLERYYIEDTEALRSVMAYNRFLN